MCTSWKSRLEQTRDRVLYKGDRLESVLNNFDYGILVNLEID
jgi:hypothetical protein